MTVRLTWLPRVLSVVALCIAGNLGADELRGEILLREDFEDNDYKARGCFDARTRSSKGEKLLSVVGRPEVKPISGTRCLRIDYPLKSSGGWLNYHFKQVPEVYCRYYRYFPKDWEWPRGYGPHDTYTIAERTPWSYELTLYLDFWKTADTFVRVATTRQKWGYGGYGEVLRKKGGAPGNCVAFNVARPDKMTPGTWHCIEYYSKLNDPGKENGRLKLWVNGKLCCDLGGLPLRDENHDWLLFNRWMLGPYFHGGSHKVQHNYLDALVVSTEYVGTLQQKGNQPPRARFQHSRKWGSMTASFDASRSADPEGTPLKYAWDFGDGTMGSGKTVRHAYAKEGNYTVKLTVTDQGRQKHSTEKNISVGTTVGSGSGLKAEYFDGQELKGTPAVTTARRLAFRRGGWNGRFIDGRAGNRNGENYSCRWSGYLQPTKSEEYTLTLEVNAGGRLYFDGKLIIDAWDRPQTKSASVGKLEAGKKYPIRVEHHYGTVKETRDWKARLYWESPSTKKGLIPATQFYLPD